MTISPDARRPTRASGACASADGAYRWVRIRGRCVRDETGRATRFAGSVSDIDRQKRAEAALRRSEERYERAMLASEAGFWEWTAATDHFYASPRLLEIGGLPPGTRFAGRADSLSRSPYHPEDLARWHEATAALFAGKHNRVEMEMRMIVSGETRWVHLNGLCTRDAAGAVARWTGSVIDITERKRAEEALRRSEARFRSLTELSSDWYWEQDENLRFTYLSPRVNALTGYTAESSIGKLRWELANLTPLSCSWSEHQAVLAARQPFRDFECSRVGPNGTISYRTISGTPIFDEHGRFKGYYGVGRDITERKQAETALRESEARYARVMEASDHGLWEWDPVADRAFVSPRGCQLFGVPDGMDLTSRAALKAHGGIHPQDVPRIDEAIQACLARRTGGFEIEYRVINQAGELRWIRSRGKLFPDAHGQPTLFTGSLTDITERKHAEEELRARQDMLDLAQKAARAVAFEWRIGADGGQNRWSPDLEAMHGLAPGSYDGTYAAWKKLVFPEDWPVVKAAIRRANETGDVAAEYRIVQPDGAVRWLQAKGRMFFDAEGRPERLLGFMLDVTERHHAEEELRRLERQLRQAQRLEAVGTLAGGIAHDFNNILGAVLGYGELALREARRGTRLRRYLGNIMTAGERGRALVERILAFSRSGVADRVAVPAEKVVGEALDLLGARLPDGVRIERRLRAGRAAVLGDPTQLHQVLMNLATNAVQAMPAGGTLRVSLEGVRLDAARVATVGALGVGDYVVLEVADAGTGMSPEVLERIFDPFFTTKDAGVGTGLGLSLVHGIVTQLGGAIEVASKVGKGSVFTVYLPRAGEAVDDRQRKEPEAPRGNRQQVLIVDDEKALVRLVTETLAALGYVPVGFTSSASALQAFRADPGRFDAVITDERMPGMSGSRLIREIRSIRGAIPILLVSGYVGDAVVRRALESGADEVLKKPLSARALATSLANVLHARQVALR